MYADWQAVKNKGVMKVQRNLKDSTSRQKKKRNGYQCYYLIQKKKLIKKKENSD